MQTVSELILAAGDAVAHEDAGPAWRCLKELAALEGKGMVLIPKEELADLKTNLYFTAFPMLPVRDAAAVLQSQLLGFLQMGMDLDDRLSVRYAFTTYGEHGQERQVLRKAMLENKEQVAGKTIGTWLMEYDKAHAPDTRDEKSAFDFLSNNRQLGERDRAVLRLILTPYENWLASERLNVFDLAYLKNNPGLLNQAARASQGGPYASQGANQAYQQSRGSGKPSQGVVKKPLLKALADYPRVGEQMVTGEKIRLKNQPEPARPSLANWIRYYRDELGVGFHDQVTRGRFLFQSVNGKQLSSEERERINLILKSIEEEFPLDIDTDRMTVVFSAAAPQPAPMPQPRPQSPAPTPAPQPKAPLSFQSPAQMTPARTVKPYVPANPLPSPGPGQITVSPGKSSFFGAPFGGPAKNVAGDTLHFSTGHVLPGEKESPSTMAQGGPTQGNPAQAAPTAQPTTPPTLTTYNMARINRPSTPPHNPYSIRPLRLRTNAQEREDEAR